MAKTNNGKSRATVSDVEVAKAIIANEAAECFVGKERKPSKQMGKLTSCTGGTFWGKRGEQWPRTTAGKPLIPWLQIVCTDMKGLYGPFYRKKAVCFFLDEDCGFAEAMSALDGGNFVVREYSIEDALEPLSRPDGLEEHVFHQVEWAKEFDYPSISKYGSLFEKSVYDALCDVKGFEFENRSGIKIGGWPTPIQSHQLYPGSFDLQIDMTENYMYADSGIGFIQKSYSAWYLRFETC